VYGSGLGLAIASNIAKQMDATLLLYSPLAGTTRGFGVSICFPDLETQTDDQDD
jgi:two-component system OmpR family sensor kinase